MPREKALEFDALSPDARTALGFVAGFGDFNSLKPRHFYRLTCAAVDPGFDTLRSHRRFSRLLATILGAASATNEHATAVTA